MATRDVILRALQDWRWSNEMPIWLVSALGPVELERIAEVAARAVEGPTEKLERVVAAAQRVGWNDRGGKCWCAESVELTGKPHDIHCREMHAALAALDALPPVGTQDEAEACGRRSGLGEVG